jgi:predicted transcriptional regulator
MNEQEFRKQVGTAIRKWRREGEITQVDLSKKIGVSQSTLSKIESGELEPGLLPYRRLCRMNPAFGKMLLRST